MLILLKVVLYFLDWIIKLLESLKLSQEEARIKRVYENKRV